MTKLRRVLLVDDYEADNFLNKMLLDNMGCAEQVDIALDGAQALRYLSTPVDGNYPRPELICLDINMPVMNGWEFLDAYAELPPEQSGGVVLMMLTTSKNPDDAKRAQAQPCVKEYTNKPLTQPVLEAFLQENFPGRF